MGPKARFTRAIFTGEIAENCRRVFFAQSSRPIKQLTRVRARNELAASDCCLPGTDFAARISRPVNEQNKERLFDGNMSRHLSDPRALFARPLSPVLMQTLFLFSFF